jgi:hypothetical protein
MTVGRNQLIAIGLAVAVGVGVLVGVLVASGDDGGGEKEDVKLVSVSEPGPGPFTPPVAPDTPPPTPTTVAPPPPQGPFGGTGDNTLCDREQLIGFLTDPANAAQAREWARVIGVSVAEIPAYVRALIPTTTTSDIRITNHTFEGGRAVGFQAVLQSGTALLVDTYGKPIARCRCGNPLRPPKEVRRPTYVGTRWPDFDPDNIFIIQETNVQVYPPGGVGPVPAPEPEPEPEPPRPSGDADEAAALVKSRLEQCVTQIPDTGEFLTPEDLQAILATITYEATPAAGPGLFTVKATGPEGDFATWTVDTSSDDVTAADPVAAEVGQFCPELA